MSKSERKLLDTTGRFTQVVRDGNKMNDIDWTDGRILLSNRRLVLAGTEGKRTLQLSKVDRIEGRYDVNRTIAQVTDYVSVRLGKDVYLVSTGESESFERLLHKTILDGEIVLVKHPAIEGGVVQDVSWRKARVKIDEDAVNLAIEDGSFVQIEIEDVGTIDQGERTVKSKERPVLETEHTVDGTSVATYPCGTPKPCSVLSSVLARSPEPNSSSIDPLKDESAVPMALHSGVRSSAAPEFLDFDPAPAAETTAPLIELDVL